MKNNVSNTIRNIRVFNNVVRISKCIRNILEICKSCFKKRDRSRNNDIHE